MAAFDGDVAVRNSFFAPTRPFLFGQGPKASLLDSRLIPDASGDLLEQGRHP